MNCVWIRTLMGLPASLGEDLASQFKAVEACLTRMVLHSQDDITLRHSSLAKVSPSPTQQSAGFEAPGTAGQAECYGDPTSPST